MRLHIRGQGKQLQSLLQASRCRLPMVRRGEVSTEAERSCDSTPLQQEEQLTSSRLLSCMLATRELFNLVLVLQLSLKLAIEKKETLLWVFFTSTPRRHIQGPHSFTKAVEKGVRSQQAVYSLPSCSSLLPSCILVGRGHDAAERPFFTLSSYLHPDL